MQMDLERLAQRAKSNCMTFNKAKPLVLHWSHNNLIQGYRLVHEWLESCSAEKELGVLADNQLNVS